MTEDGPETTGSADPGTPGSGDPGTRGSGDPGTPGSGVQPPPATGDPSVDAALQRLYESTEVGDLDEQAEAGEATHRALQDRLADLGGG